MMPNDDDDCFNPPAFPSGDGKQIGMTLRDWFAGQALVGLAGQFNGKFSEEAAARAYLAADAMLIERLP